jgi:HTH-type transcriptional regulator/antitoxin HigA
MANPLTPAEVFPPGEFLRDELEARGWSQADLAEILGRPPRVVSEIICGKRAITPETAQGLGEAFGTGAEFWLHLESAYQLSKIEPEGRDIAKRARLFEKAPIKELIRRHWIEASKDSDVLEARLLAFLGIASLEQEPPIWAYARKSSSYEEFSPAQWAWLCRARQLACAVPAEPFSPQRLAAALERLRPLLAAADGAQQVSAILAEGGVRFLVIEHLANTRIDGACLWLDETSPVVVLSLRYDRIDGFWFTLLHELGHVQAKDGLINKARPLDIDLVGNEDPQAGEGPPVEQRANRFAVNWLIPQDSLRRFITKTRPYYSKQKIRAFAASLDVHPGLVVGQLQFRGEIPYTHNREMLTRVRDIVTSAALTDGWGSMVPPDL